MHISLSFFVPQRKFTTETPKIKANIVLPFVMTVSFSKAGSLSFFSDNNNGFSRTVLFTNWLDQDNNNALHDILKKWIFTRVPLDHFLSPVLLECHDIVKFNF